jgi:hypothetical protein
VKVRQKTGIFLTQGGWAGYAPLLHAKTEKKTVCRILFGYEGKKISEDRSDRKPVGRDTGPTEGGGGRL